MNVCICVYVHCVHVSMCGCVCLHVCECAQVCVATHT